MRTLLQGKPYVSSAETDLRKTFARVRKQLKEQQAQQLANEQEAKAKTVQLKKVKA